MTTLAVLLIELKSAVRGGDHSRAIELARQNPTAIGPGRAEACGAEE